VGDQLTRKSAVETAVRDCSEYMFSSVL